MTARPRVAARLCSMQGTHGRAHSQSGQNARVWGPREVEYTAGSTQAGCLLSVHLHPSAGVGSAARQRQNDLVRYQMATRGPLSNKRQTGGRGLPWQPGEVERTRKHCHSTNPENSNPSIVTGGRH